LAINCLTSWCSPISSPNVRRSCAYRTLRIETRLRETDRAGRDGVATLVDGAHRDQEALPSSPIRFSPARHVVEVDQAGVARTDPELAVERAGRQARHPALDHEGGDALVLPERSTRRRPGSGRRCPRG
jgi:hypothetical protein